MKAGFLLGRTFGRRLAGMAMTFGLVFGLAFGLVLSGAAWAAGTPDVVYGWDAVKAPPPPAVKPVTLDAKTTALLMLDFATPNCTTRPRCMAQLPEVKRLLDSARARGVLVVYSTGPAGKRADTVSDVFPLESEAVVSTGVDKFFNTDLEKRLRDRGIETVIAIGTAAQGAVLYTASAAALRGMKVIVPVDGLSDTPYSEQYTVWHLANAPIVSRSVTLTRLNTIAF